MQEVVQKCVPRNKTHDCVLERKQNMHSEFSNTIPNCIFTCQEWVMSPLEHARIAKSRVYKSRRTVGPRFLIIILKKPP